MRDFFHLLDIRIRIVGHGVEVKGVKKSTTATHWSRLNRFFEWLFIRKEIEVNPLKNVGFPKVYYDNRQYLSGPDVKKIINTVYTMPAANNFIKKRNIAIFMTYLFTGMRRGELLGLKDKNVNLEKRTIKISKETSKSKIDRTVNISRELYQILIDYISDKRVGHDYFFLSTMTNSRLSNDGLKHLVNKVKQLSGVNFHLHQLRHTYAVNFLSKGGDIAQLKQILGHRDIRMTAVYLRCLPTEMMRDINNTIRLDDLVE